MYEDFGTVLYCTSCRKHIDVVQLLIEKGANPNIANNNGQTAAHIAVQIKNNAMLKTLQDKCDFNICVRFSTSQISIWYPINWIWKRFSCLNYQYTCICIGVILTCILPDRYAYVNTYYQYLFSSKSLVLKDMYWYIYNECSGTNIHVRYDICPIFYARISDKTTKTTVITL